MLILALAMLGQAELDRARGLEFTRIQIDWIASTGTVHSFDEILPWRQAELLRQLDCPSYGCRKLARDELVRMGDDAAETLLWGTHYKGHPEVVATCESLLTRLFLCRDCGASGKCQACKNMSDGHYEAQCPNKCNYAHNCTACDGVVDLRWCRKPYDDSPPVPRELFGRATK